jgi:hypothetical protein
MEIVGRANDGIGRDTKCRFGGSGRTIRPAEDIGIKTGKIALNLLTRVTATEAPAEKRKERQLVSAAGLEPATHALKGHCSTN